MVTSRTCQAVTKLGEPCRQPPLRDEDLCFWHSPTHAGEAADARRLGGLRRRREKTLQGAYEYEGLDSTPQLRRILDIVVADGLGLESSVARGRLLIAAVLAATRLLEVGELEARLSIIENRIIPLDIAEILKEAGA